MDPISLSTAAVRRATSILLLIGGASIPIAILVGGLEEDGGTQDFHSALGRVRI